MSAQPEPSILAKSVSRGAYLGSAAVGGAAVGIVHYFAINRSVKDSVLVGMLCTGAVGGSFFLAKAAKTTADKHRAKLEEAIHK